MELPKKKIITSKLVKVLVGRDSSSQQHVDIHEGLLRHNSAFCNNALNGAQAQSPSRRVEKPETNPVIFEIWVKRRPPRPEFKDACTDACFEILSDTPAMHKEFPGWIYTHSQLGYMLRDLIVKTW
ncbi:hypothetical protein HBH75_009380 [Parastagonospora nodorum]|nr:hypothetical protein HBH75_009380 [Parastagonospora nodorum]